VRSIRHRLVAFAAALLACQLAAFGIAPVLLYQARTAAGASELLCDCKVEPGAECPMHGGKKHEGARQRVPRVSPVCGDQAAAVLTLLATSGGVVQTSPRPIDPPSVASTLTLPSDAAVDRSHPPTSPPPRG
jgi:hypothetical protein